MKKRKKIKLIEEVLSKKEIDAFYKFVKYIKKRKKLVNSLNNLKL